MAKLERWQYGDTGKTVKTIIDTNFVNLNEQVNQLAKRFALPFTVSDWVGGKIYIPYSQYQKAAPCVDLYMKNGDGYSFVYGGYEVKADGIELQSDMPYEGKVVIR